MMQIRRAAERGTTNLGWLDSKHTFSFGRYIDRDWWKFGSLRVLNDDIIAGGGGFGTHPHEEMEIVSLVLRGTLTHRDSEGHESTMRRFGVQRMSAGTGIEHSEFNASTDEPAHLYQLWLLPNEPERTPSYEEATFDLDSHKGELITLVSDNPPSNALHIGADASVQGGILRAGDSARTELRPNGWAWVQVAEGSATLHAGAETVNLNEGDGAGITEHSSIELIGSAPDNAHTLLYVIEGAPPRQP